MNVDSKICQSCESIQSISMMQTGARISPPHDGHDGYPELFVPALKIGLQGNPRGRNRDRNRLKHESSIPIPIAIPTPILNLRTPQAHVNVMESPSEGSGGGRTPPPDMSYLIWHLILVNH